MATKKEPPQLDFHLWPPKFSARGTVAIITAAVLTIVWLALAPMLSPILSSLLKQIGLYP